jgi:FkbM family methyltransferase
MIPTAAALVEKLPRLLRRHRLMTAWMKLTGEPALQLVRIRDNAFGYADMSDGFLRLIVIDQGFEKDFFGIADRLLAGGGTFLDVGANHGLLSFGLAARHGSAVDFHLFEPNPKLVASIEKTKSLYPNMRLQLNAVAVSDTPGVVAFEIDEGQTGASHISAEGRGVQVPCITLDDYIERAGLKRIELVKLDVEGYELAALRGMVRALRSRTVGAIYFEYFEKWLQRVAPPSELLKFLDGEGFVACFCREGDFGPRGGATHSLAEQGPPLLPIEGHTLPAMTDLMAAPRESLRPLPA